MINGSLGAVAYGRQDQIVSGDRSTMIIAFLETDFNLNAQDHAQVAVTFTAIGPFGWRFSVESGDASLLGLIGGNITSQWKNTYTFTGILRANSTGPIKLWLRTSTSTNPLCTISNGSMLVKVIGRATT